jgi:ribonuclease HII
MIWIGIDEAGMGTLAGPMTAAVVCIESDQVPKGVRDSKKLGEEQREELAAKIMEVAVDFKTAVRTAEDIDKYGMSKCWEDMIRELCYFARLMHPKTQMILDGNRLVGLSYVRAVVKADDRFLSVSAASILAKYVQCCWMDDYHNEYPQYGFNRHRGYGTVKHIRRLKELGPCPIHRKTFKPVKNAIHSIECGSKQLWE